MWYLICDAWHQRCCRLLNFRRSPKFVSFKIIAQILCVIFKVGQMPQKASKCYRNNEKAPKNSKEFQHICQKLPKSFRFFFSFQIAHNFFVFFVKITQKSSQKAPKFWRDFNLVTSLLDMGYMMGGDHSFKISAPQFLRCGINSVWIKGSPTEWINESMNHEGDCRTAPSSSYSCLPLPLLLPVLSPGLLPDSPALLAAAARPSCTVNTQWKGDWPNPR